ncbi:MAG TPA: DUF3606 domain-containing protein [Telluria sp.]
MADNLQKAGPQDRARINVNERWERDYWTRALGVSEEELERAVKAVGPAASAVREYLGKK